ncbi:MAG: hypothetical protein ACK4RW_04550 [Rehaibacterium terrae]|uniref:hypothetical protein n=1 Tax=Rehaibacterium terrae TaxID=1341696 RepID=UPI00391AB0BF
MSLRTALCRRIAVLALLAMVFNQAAFAAHLCMEAALQSRSGAVAGTMADAATHADCERVAAGTRQAMDAWCAAHCAHETDSNQQAKLLGIPALPPACLPVFDWHLATALPSGTPPVIDDSPPIERRLVVFVSLLI